MSPRKLLAVALCGLTGLGLLIAAEPEPAKIAPLVIIDAAGKEHKLKSWKIVAGVRHLGWLAPAEKPEPEEKKEPDDKDKKAPKGRIRRAPTGPEALEFREEGSTNFVEGVITLIPLDRLRSIDYDADTDSVSVTVATSDKPEGDVVLKGSTKFRGVNKLVIEAEVDKGDLGVAEIKFQGGVAKSGIRGVRFPAPKALAAAAAGRTASVTANDKKDKGPFKVTDLQALYRVPDGGERLLPTLYFRKTLKVDLGQLESLHRVEGNKEEGSEWSVKFKEGEEHVLTLLPQLPDEKQAPLEALVGRAPAGYRVFPIGLIAGIDFDEGKNE